MQERPARRYDLVDAARGVAIAAMIVYHASWDLSFLRLIAADVTGDPAWRLFAMTIAASFLTLVGVGLALASEGGLDRRRYAWRLGKIAAAAALVTLATFLAFPDSFIYFGILHSIAVGSVLALPFLRLPVAVVVAAALVVLALPHLVSWPALDTRALAWIGLGATPPPTNDYEPVFPWFGAVLLGLALGRSAHGSSWGRLAMSWRARAPLGRALVWAGRRSLAIYLLHQPLLLAALYPVSLSLGPNLAAETRSFTRSCEAACTGAGRTQGTCRAACLCVVDGLKAKALWDDALRSTASPVQREAMTGVSRGCFEAHIDGEP